MHIILGGTGQVGSAAAFSLLAHGEPVTVVTRQADHADALRAAGAEIAIADSHDAASLARVFGRGRRVLLLNPPGDPAGDIDADERRGVAAILTALEGADLEKAVVVSTYGARPGERCGDLTVLHELEQGARACHVPTAINRGAYYMSNWLPAAREARDQGRLLSFLPADVPIAMVAPRDLGREAARRLLEPAEDTGLRHVEGPRRYAPADVAARLSDLFGRGVELDVVPRADWEARYRRLGFSPASAASFSRMTGVVVDGKIEEPEAPVRGVISLRTYLGSHLAD